MFAETRTTKQAGSPPGSQQGSARICQQTAATVDKTYKIDTSKSTSSRYEPPLLGNAAVDVLTICTPVVALAVPCQEAVTLWTHTHQLCNRAACPIPPPSMRAPWRLQGGAEMRDLACVAVPGRGRGVLLHFGKVPFWERQVQELIHHDGVHWIGPAYISLVSRNPFGGGGACSAITVAPVYCDNELCYRRVRTQPFLGLSKDHAGFAQDLGKVWANPSGSLVRVWAEPSGGLVRVWPG